MVNVEPIAANEGILLIKVIDIDQIMYEWGDDEEELKVLALAEDAFKIMKLILEMETSNQVTLWDSMDRF